MFSPADDLLHRIKTAYREAIESAGPTQGMWSDIDTRRADLHAALTGDNLETLRDLLADPLTTDLYYGVDGVCRSIFGQLQDVQSFRKNVTAMLQGSLSLLFKVLTGSPEIMFERLDDILRHRVEFPSPFRGEIGLPTERGLASERAIAAIYQAALLRKLADGEPGTQSIIEIGPGMGRTAYYAYRAGFPDYTTVDLPMGIVAQACFLAATLGANAIWLPGDDAQLMNGRIRLLPQRPNRQFDIAMNVDSLPEMPVMVAFDYVTWINRHARRFISINHEQNGFTIAQIGAAVLPRRAHRKPHPLRDTYYEDIFDIPAPRPDAGARARLKWRLRIGRIRYFVGRAIGG